MPLHSSQISSTSAYKDELTYYADQFQRVLGLPATVKVVERATFIRGMNAGEVADHDHGAWYRELFAPSVAVGLLKPADLAGYRNAQVYIRNSMHVPMNSDAVRDALPAFFDLLRQEQEPAVRVVLGHFLFVYIHPYMDGNGRMGRFLMNVMLASGGYPWTVIPVSERRVYMSALEQGAYMKTLRHLLAFSAGLPKRGFAENPTRIHPDRYFARSNANFNVEGLA